MISQRQAQLLYLRELIDGPHAENLSEMDRVIQSKIFQQCPKKQKLFQFMVEEAVLGNEHKEISLGFEIFNQNYDPAKNSDVRVAVRDIRKLLMQFYETEATASTVRISIPRGSYTPRFSVPRFPVSAQLTGKSFLTGNQAG